MASKVSMFGRRPPSPKLVDEEVVLAQPVNLLPEVTSTMVDEAVEDVLRELPTPNADALRFLWGNDHNSAMAKAYFADQVRARTNASFAKLNKRQVIIEESLSTDEVTKIVDYAQEYDLIFRNSIVHEHGFFSARRKIDHQKLLASIPSTRKYLDVGGSVMYHVRAQHTRAVVVAPFNADSKDTQREALTWMGLRTIKNSASAPSTSREMARSVLAGEGLYHLPVTAQEVNTRDCQMSMSCHVYDVPLIDWAYMMDRCGILVHEGCLHWSNEFLVRDSGTIEYSGAYYEIDRRKDVIRMRIGESASSWYEHKWSHYMLYAANQILCTDRQKYSYQITERRADTIFFRILRVGAHATPDRNQVYRLPDIPMVEVRGFDVLPRQTNSDKTRRSRMSRRTYIWPAELWNRMVKYCVDESIRGGYSYDKAYNYYRTIAPEQSINGVRVSGGHRVSMDELPALVVMSAAVGHCNMWESRRALAYQTAEIQRDRGMRDEATLWKLVMLFWEVTVGCGRLLFSPFALLALPLTAMQKGLVSDQMVTWKPQVELRSLNMALFIDHKKLDYSVEAPAQLDLRQDIRDDHVAELIDLVQNDAALAEVVLQSCGGDLPKEFKNRLTLTAMSVSNDDGTTLVPARSVGGTAEQVSIKAESPGVTWITSGVKRIQRTVLDKQSMVQVVQERRASVVEAIRECEAETTANVYTCERVFREIIDGKIVKRDIIRKRREELYNPDIWQVSDGLLVNSVLYEGAELNYSAVYTPYPDSDGNKIVPIYEHMWTGEDSRTGELVTRVHMRMPWKYTGYALVIDALKIYNGPAVVATLERVLRFPDEAFEFRVVNHQGPPGCGKTTTVVNDGDPLKDVYLAPTRLSVAGLREKLVEAHNVTVKRVSEVARTMDSFLVNYERLPASAKQGFRSLLFDEHVLARAGKVVAAVVLLDMKDVHIYGDMNQIAHVTRVQVSDRYVRMLYQELQEEYLTFRCAPRILAGFNYVYDHKVRSTRKEEGEVRVVRLLSEIQFMDDVRILTMYQAEKKAVQGMLAGTGRTFRINTVHEAQGTDCDQVILYNSEVRARPVDDPSRYLANVQSYCLVAMSRARLSFIYWKPAKVPDLMSAMVEKAQDPRRLRACRDVETQGQSIEFI